jgi:murein L,D-transpeptidase YcbB/YkuD
MNGPRAGPTLVLLIFAVIATCATTNTAAQAQALSNVPPVRMVLNIPATRLDVWSGDSLLRTFRVAVGARAFPTPTGEFQVTELTWNPWWLPPASDWAKNEKAQPPGPKNNMGRVKLRFGPALYLHGTPFANSIGSASSHGCVRMRNADAIELAQLVLTVAGPQLEIDVLDSLILDVTATRRVQLDCALPLSVRYDVVEVRAGALEVHTDIYRRGIDVRAAALATLEAAGYETWQLDLDRLDKFLQQRKRPSDRISLRLLMKAANAAR